MIRALVPGAPILEVLEEGTGTVVGELDIGVTLRACSRACSRIGRFGSAIPCAPIMRAAAGICDDPYRYPPVLGEMDV